MGKEQNIQDEIRLALSEYGPVFRCNAGDFWQGKRVWSEEFQQFVLINMRRVKGLPEGFSDLFWVGEGKVAFIEVKTPTGKVREAQERFRELMKSYGHIAGVVRSPEDAVKLIKGG